jgi:hypothetical protein
LEFYFLYQDFSFAELEIKNYQKEEKRDRDKNRKIIESLHEGDDDKKQAIDSNSYLPNKSKNLLNFKEVFIETSWKNRSLLAVSQAGLVNNLVFGVSWGLFTLYFL